MFTGIIEGKGIVRHIEHDNTNIHFTFQSPFTKDLKVDQSVAHNGVCLTVVAISDDVSTYTVTAIQETLDKTNLGKLQIGDVVNLERCTLIGGRLDGHIVQGHVDQIGICKSIENLNGSWKFTFEHERGEHITVSKGSITINGVSLTVVDSTAESFSVAIIPFTYEHTNFKELKIGSQVNLEFDIIGKYVSKLMAHYAAHS
jgi:riboflavin synthase